jgi:glycine/D-amino acid oxidase-like deaminating enzyme
MYTKVHNDTIYMGAFEANPVFVEIEQDLVFGLYDLDWDVYQPYLEKHIEIMPKLANVGHRTVICGPETFTPDGMPLFGKPSEVNNTYNQHRFVLILHIAGVHYNFAGCP